MKYIFLLSLIFSIYLNAEVSAFGAGKLDAKNPYGLTEGEKVIYANKKAILSNRKEIKSLSYKVDQLTESIEGLRSVVDSLSEKVGQTGQQLHQMDADNTHAKNNEIQALKDELSEQKAYAQKLSTALQKLTVMIDDMSVNYVKKSDLPTRKKKVTSKKKVTNKVLLNSAIRLFRAKKYDDASLKFALLAKKSYKPAMSNYYLGECAYYQKKYEAAIVYFKKSAGYYDKASYMPTLLLHTALSFEKLEDSENAKRFFQAVIGSYPKSAQAKIAQKHL